MNRFFVEDNQIEGQSAYIIGSDVNHIKNVLRLNTGEVITICDRQGIEYCCIISSITDDRVDLSIDEQAVSDRELSTKIYLFQGLPKSDKMELIIQKCIELGVYEIIPVKMTRSIVKLAKGNEEKKINRWNKIALSAAKQSKRAIVPEVKTPMTMSEAIEYAKELDANLVPYESASNINETKSMIKGLKGKGTVGIFIGPEGGFDSQEINKLIEIKANIITLGRRILRTETAGLMILSLLMFELEEQ